MFLYRKVLVVSVLQSANVMMAIQQMHFAFTYIQNLACLVDFSNPTKVYFSLFNSSHFFDKFFLVSFGKMSFGTTLLKLSLWDYLNEFKRCIKTQIKAHNYC